MSEFLKSRNPNWQILAGDEYDSIDSLVAAIIESQVDLICTYRNLKTPADSFPFSLGSHLDIMTQATAVPVLVLPRPEMPNRSVPDNMDSIMVITDHLTGDDRLVSVAVNLSEPGGSVILTHVEDERQLKRFLDTIGKIPSLNTENADQTLRDQLLKEPADYIDTIRVALEELDLKIEIDAIVTMGNHLRDYRRLIEEHKVDLLVMNTKDDEQLAMHGLAYPLTVELRNTPMLLL
ncbi:MAG: hypothetical protein AAF497_22025 [Planctomycetota bacterium]